MRLHPQWVRESSAQFISIQYEKIKMLKNNRCVPLTVFFPLFPFGWKIKFSLWPHEYKVISFSYRSGPLFHANKLFSHFRSDLFPYLDRCSTKFSYSVRLGYHWWPIISSIRTREPKRKKKKQRNNKTREKDFSKKIHSGSHSILFHWCRWRCFYRDLSDFRFLAIRSLVTCRPEQQKGECQNRKSERKNQ